MQEGEVKLVERNSVHRHTYSSIFISCAIMCVFLLHSAPLPPFFLYPSQTSAAFLRPVVSRCCEGRDGGAEPAEDAADGERRAESGAPVTAVRPSSAVDDAEPRVTLIQARVG